MRSYANESHYLYGIKAGASRAPAVRDRPLYRGRRSATAIGAAGELVERVEIAR